MAQYELTDPTVRANRGAAAGGIVREPDGSDFTEFALVAAVGPVLLADGALPPGSVGTIVAIWEEGLAFEVEFPPPAGCVVTLERSQIALAPLNDGHGTPRW